MKLQALNCLLVSYHTSFFPSLTVVPPNTAPPNTASPPKTAAHFQVPNKGFLGYIWLPIPPISEYRRFFVSPKIGGIGGEAQ